MNAEEFVAAVEQVYRNCTMGIAPPASHIFCIECQKFADELPVCDHLARMFVANQPGETRHAP